MNDWNAHRFGLGCIYALVLREILSDRGGIDEIGVFRLHGRGCRFEVESGAVVDVDWDEHGRAVIGSWGMLMYARAIGDESITRESLRAAASDSPMLTQLDRDTFAWRHTHYDLAWVVPS